MVEKLYSMDEAIGVMAGALNQKHSKLWLGLPRATQERIIRIAFDKGVITHKRGDDEKLH